METSEIGPTPTPIKIVNKKKNFILVVGDRITIKVTIATIKILKDSGWHCYHLYLIPQASSYRNQMDPEEWL